MLTWIVDQKDVDSKFSLQDLMTFSKKHSARIIIKGFCTMEKGIIAWMM